MRPSPPSPPADIKRKAQQADDRNYRFLTYVFGGGVKVRDHEKHGDTVTPVRVASVRGQLRFWWRACNPSRCTTVEELRQREGEIWGTTSRASSVEITVLAQPRLPRRVPVFEYNEKKRLVPCNGMREIAYGAFPLQPSREAQQAGGQPWVLFDYGSAPFSLRFTYPEGVREDVEAALWSWETFGGLGGRTRRGFGAISRADGQSMLVATGISRYGGHPKIPGVPSLHLARFENTKETFGDPLQAWKAALGLLQKIRQGEGYGRNDRPQNSRKPAGRSRWPEPDEIRRLTGKSAPAHKNPVVTVQRFPRAVFGMPIVFHFNPGSHDEPGSQGDPDMKPLQLLPAESERFASPLILRPLPAGEGFHAAALALCSDLPKLKLVADQKIYPADWQLDVAQAKDIPALARQGTVFTDPIELFLSELKK